MIATADPSDAPVRSRATAAKVYLGVLLAAWALYAFTAQRGPAWQDSGMHQQRALAAEYDNPLGLALAHPLLIAMAQPLRVFGDAHLPLAMNLLSGAGMAVTVANVFLLGLWLTDRPGAAVVAALMLAIGHTSWWLATITETYCWATAGLTTELLLCVLLIRQPAALWVIALGVVNGLGLSMHNFALLPTPVYATLVGVAALRRRIPLWSLPAALLGWLAGAAPLLALVIGEGIASGDWPATIRSALFGSAWQSDVLAGSPAAVKRAALYIGLNWPLLSLVPVVLGWAAMARRVGRPVAAALGAVTAIHFVFAARYPVADQFMFLLPTHVLLAVGAAVGLDRIDRMPQRRRAGLLAGVFSSILLTPVLYGVVAGMLTSADKSIRPNRRLPFRNENRYWITPWKHNERSAELMAADVFERAGPGAVVLPSSTATPPLRVARLAWDVRADMRIETFETVSPDALGENPEAFTDTLDGRPLYAIDETPSTVPAALGEGATLETAGSLTRIRLKSPGAGQ